MAVATKSAQGNLQLGLFILRIATAAFFLAWALDKFIDTTHTVKVFDKFYFLAITPGIAMAVGIVQLALIAAFAFGLWKTWTTGALMVMHAVSVLASWKQLIFAHTMGTLLFWAGVPVLAALLLLWLVRDSDTMCTLKLGK